MRADALRGAARALYDDFRRVGLSEAAALAAAVDERVQEDLFDLDLSRTFGRAGSPADQERRLRAIGEAAASRRAGAPTRTSLAEADVEAAIAGAFSRPVPGWAAKELARIGPLDESVGRRSLQESAGTLTAARLREAATATGSQGRLRVRLIAPGQGSSGYYSPELLKRDGPKVFTAGLQSYLDHPTEAERYDRPERSVRDLAGQLATTAVWEDHGPLGAGLYADVEVFAHAAPLLASVGRSIGVSIRAEGEADSNGNITALTAAHSLDFVTRAGAGGAIVI